MTTTSPQDVGTDRQETVETHIDPSEIEHLPAEPLTDEPLTEGQRVRLMITPQDFLPGRDPLWPARNISGQPRGTIVRLGALAGYVTSVEEKTNPYKDKMLTSYHLNGEFRGLIAETGEVLTAPLAIIPKSYGKQIYNAFHEYNLTRVEIDVDICLEATGRNIPYEWVILTYVEGAAQKAVKAISERQRARLHRVPPMKQIE